MSTSSWVMALPELRTTGSIRTRLRNSLGARSASKTVLILMKYVAIPKDFAYFCLFPHLYNGAISACPLRRVRCKELEKCLAPGEDSETWE